MNKEFTVSMSSFFKTTTYLLISLLILIGFAMSYNEPNLTPNIIYWAVITPLIIGCYLFSLNKIKVDLNNIYLISKIRTTIIPINEIENIARKSQNNLMIIGARGIYVLIGISMDNYKCNIKDRTKLVAIELENAKYLISCDLPEEFIHTINTLKNDKKNP
ncbi:PH domain-containing protein [Empedobacter brevis]|uniref:PH domain-containing protein n=1 Tax=Empedobacter brevis TaxID=247 RepID=UPI0039AFDC64